MLVLLPYPVAAAIPLLVLVATFEVIRPLHFGAERIGRYLQVFYEEDGEPEPSLERHTLVGTRRDELGVGSRRRRARRYSSQFFSSRRA